MTVSPLTVVPTPIPSRPSVGSRSTEPSTEDGNFAAHLEQAHDVEASPQRSVNSRVGGETVDSDESATIDVAADAGEGGLAAEDPTGPHSPAGVASVIPNPAGLVDAPAMVVGSVSSDASAAQEVDASAAQEVDASAAQEVDAPAAQEVDAPATQEVDGSPAAITVPTSGSADAPVTSMTETSGMPVPAGPAAAVSASSATTGVSGMVSATSAQQNGAGPSAQSPAVPSGAAPAAPVVAAAGATPEATTAAMPTGAASADGPSVDGAVGSVAQPESGASVRANGPSGSASFASSASAVPDPSGQASTASGREWGAGTPSGSGTPVASSSATPAPAATDASTTASAQSSASTVHASQTAVSTGTPTVATPAADAPARPGAMPPEVPVTDQVAAHLSSFRTRADGTYETTVTLTPEELGQVSVRVQVSQGSVSIQALAVQGATADAMRDALPQLRQDLQDAGLDLADSQIDQGSRGDGRPEESPPRESGAIREFSSDPRDAVRWATQVDQATIRQQSSDGRLDILV